MSSAENIFLFFPENRLTVHQIFSLGNICLKCQSLFSEKINEMPSAKIFTQHVKRLYLLSAGVNCGNSYICSTVFLLCGIQNPNSKSKHFKSFSLK